METNEKLSDAQTEDLVMELMKGDTLDHRIGVYFEFGQFASMEKEIAKDARWSCLYSIETGKRFKLGEPKIAEDALWAFRYASEVLHESFELGEKAISQDARLSVKYAKDVLKGRFALGERAISTDARCSIQYAIHVLKRRFELGEKVIENSFYYDDYVKFIDSHPTETYYGR